LTRQSKKPRNCGAFFWCRQRRLTLSGGSGSQVMTRFFGMGFALGTKMNTQRQLFRMDWQKMPGSAHYPGDGSYADYWVDPGFEFHVPREPQ
jgi:hypothetical protein